MTEDKMNTSFQNILTIKDQGLVAMILLNVFFTRYVVIRTRFKNYIT